MCLSFYAFMLHRIHINNWKLYVTMKLYISMQHVPCGYFVGHIQWDRMHHNGNYKYKSYRIV